MSGAASEIMMNVSKQKNSLLFSMCANLLFIVLAFFSCTKSVEKERGVQSDVKSKPIKSVQNTEQDNVANHNSNCGFNQHLPFGSSEFDLATDCYRFYGHFDDPQGVLAVYSITPAGFQIDSVQVDHIILYYINGFLTKKGYILNPTNPINVLSGPVKILDKMYLLKRRSSYSVLFEVARPGTVDS